MDVTRIKIKRGLSGGYYAQIYRERGMKEREAWIGSGIIPAKKLRKELSECSERRYFRIEVRVITDSRDAWISDAESSFFGGLKFKYI